MVGAGCLDPIAVPAACSANYVSLLFNCANTCGTCCVPTTTSTTTTTTAAPGAPTTTTTPQSPGGKNDYNHFAQ
uniref:ShKT domain-containing protein n=1 Tax=Acrobeloides nanus TaxID=290746 RepID=A0A914E226_9BILA